MKKIIVLATVLLAAVGCTTAPPANTSNTNSANVNKTAETKTTGAVSESDIIAREKSSWDAIKKKDWDGFGKMLASDYVEVLDDGVHDKAASIASLKDFELTDVTYADWKMIPIDKDAVVITYTTTVKGTYKGTAVPTGPYRETAAYVNRNGEWVEIYYQETLSRAAASTPSPTTAPPSPAKAASSPATAPATGPDAIANEKIVWDLFTTRNWNGFAALLTDEFTEIEADGVYDKAASVNALSSGGMEAAKFQLSDWKSLKFDDDASLVTYTLTAPGPKPAKEYHATIWVNRAGKWLALLHQGTPAGAPPAPSPSPKNEPKK